MLALHSVMSTCYGIVLWWLSISSDVQNQEDAGLKAFLIMYICFAMYQPAGLCPRQRARRTWAGDKAVKSAISAWVDPKANKSEKKCSVTTIIKPVQD